MGRYFLNTQPLRSEIGAKEAHLRANETEWADVLSRLEGLETCDATKEMFPRFVSGEWTIKELGAAIDEYLNRKNNPYPRARRIGLNRLK